MAAVASRAADVPSREPLTAAIDQAVSRLQAHVRFLQPSGPAAAAQLSSIEAETRRMTAEAESAQRQVDQANVAAKRANAELLQMQAAQAELNSPELIAALGRLEAQLNATLAILSPSVTPATPATTRPPSLKMTPITPPGGVVAPTSPTSPTSPPAPVARPIVTPIVRPPPQEKIGGGMHGWFDVGRRPHFRPQLPRQKPMNLR